MNKLKALCIEAAFTIHEDLVIERSLCIFVKELNY